MSWPKIDDEPVNEFNTQFLITMAFPSLFPDSNGDPTNDGMYHYIPLGEKIEHLKKFGEKKDDKWVYCFAQHPRFSYWALDMIQKRRTLDQAGIFLKQNLG